MSLLHKRKHIWIKVKDVPGTYRCSYCGCYKFSYEGPTVIARDGVVDNSKTRDNCFKLSKD